VTALGWPGIIAAMIRDKQHKILLLAAACVVVCLLVLAVGVNVLKRPDPATGSSQNPNPSSSNSPRFDVVQQFMDESFQVKSPVVFKEYVPIRGKMGPTLSDWAHDLVRKDDIKRTGKSKYAEPDQRVQGVYYVEFRNRVGYDSRASASSKRWLFFIHPDGGIAAAIASESANWREEISGWVTPER
jgi:hypothetical protein